MFVVKARNHASNYIFFSPPPRPAVHLPNVAKKRKQKCGPFFVEKLTRVGNWSRNSGEELYKTMIYTLLPKYNFEKTPNYLKMEILTKAYFRVKSKFISRQPISLHARRQRKNVAITVIIAFFFPTLFAF